MMEIGDERELGRSIRSRDGLNAPTCLSNASTSDCRAVSSASAIRAFAAASSPLSVDAAARPMSEKEQCRAHR